MPSPESAALQEHFASMASRAAANPGMDIATLRDMTEELSHRQREPTDVTYEESSEPPVRSLWVRPANAVEGRVILYTHGGGYIGHTMSTSRKLVGHLAKAARAHALVPDYRLAPEHPFPAQLDDTTTTYRWLVENSPAGTLIAIAGESAGGNLAAATALRLGGEGDSLPSAVVGFSPWFDLLGETPSFDRNAESDAFLSREMSTLMAKMFLGKDGSAHDPLVNPRYADLTGFPPTYLTAGSDETLVDSVRFFAKAARSHGVDVTLEVAAGMQHAYQWMAGRAPEADQSIADAGSWLQRQFTPTP